MTRRIAPESTQDDTRKANGVLRRLEAACQSAFRRWYTINSDPETLVDPAKHRAFCAARIAYQDAKLVYVFALRHPSVTAAQKRTSRN